MDNEDVRQNLDSIATYLKLTPEELKIATDISHDLAISVASTLTNLRNDLLMTHERAQAIMAFVLASETMAITIAHEKI